MLEKETSFGVAAMIGLGSRLGSLPVPFAEGGVATTVAKIAARPTPANDRTKAHFLGSIHPARIGISATRQAADFGSLG